MNLGLADSNAVLTRGIHAARSHRRKARSDLRELWRLQDDFADTVDKAWQSAMAPAVRQFGANPGGTASGIADGLRRLDQIAIRFGRSSKLEDYTDEMLRGAYATGVLFVYDRWEDLRDGRSGEVDEQDGFREPATKATPDAHDLIVQVSFTQADEAALAELSEGAMVWFRDRSGAAYFDPAARQAIVEQARVMIRDGRSTIEIATAMREAAEKLYGVGTFAGRSRSYWGGVAEHMATVAGVRGQLAEMVELGFTHYTLVNVMDDRTTRICQMMNGKTVVVEHAVEHHARLASATTPDDVKKIHPFAPGGGIGLVSAALGRALPIGASVLSPSDSATLARAGVAVPPFHFRCRTFLDVHYEGPGRTPRLASPPVSPDKR